MKPEESENIHEAWLARRRQEFSGADLSFLVMASVRTSKTPREPRSWRFASGLGLPSPIVGLARLILLVLLILTPA